MQIHTVKKGDTIFKIARQYSTPPMKIIENNELEAPDRLAVGQKLLILNPTRTYTVRGSDELSKIAARFDVKYEKLLANNPYLYGRDKLYPGQILTIKHDMPKYGMASANGYCYKDVTSDRLSLAMPYITYLTVGSGRRVGDDIKKLFDDRNTVSEAKRNKKKVFLRIYDDYAEFSDSYAENLLKSLKEGEYDGVMLAASCAMKSAPDKYAAFLMNLKKRLMEEDLLLFSEIDGNDMADFPDICDGYTVMYEKACLENIPDFNDGEEKMMTDYASNFEAAKAYIDIPTLAYMGNEELLISEAENLAYTSGRDINYDGEKKICTFSYNKYRAGKRETVRVAFESLENLKAKLELVGGLGFMGVSFDIMKVPVEYLMLFEVMFSHPPIYGEM